MREVTPLLHFMKMEGDDLDDCDVVRPKPVQSSSPVLRNLDDGLGLTFADEISSTEVNGVCYNDAGSCENALLESDISAKDIVEDDNFDGGSDKCSYLCDDDEFLRAERFNVDAFMEDFVLDSIAVQFHADVFLVQFVCHVFFPLAYVLINYKGQGFEITRDVLVQPRFYINIVTCLFVYAMVISYFMCPVEDQKPISGALWVPLIFFIQHRMTIGLKYASLSPTEYEKFQKTTDVNQAYRYLTQMQLLNGWATRSSLLLQFELGCAAARLGAKINEISISIADPSTRATARNDFANWNALLQHRSTVSLSARPAPELVRHDDGSYTLSVYDLCRAVIMKADVSSTQRMKFLIYIFMVLINAVPWANILADPDKFPHRSVYLYVFLGTNVLIMGLFGTVAFLILYVSVWDVSRQLHMVSYLHRLIRITDLTLDSDFTFRKGRDDVRAREHIREKIDVILSVTKPERSKSIAIRKSLSAKPTVSFSSSRDPSPRSDSSTRVYNSLGANIAKMELNERSKADVRPDSEFLLGENSARISARNASVSSRELKLRFAEFGVKSMKEGDGSHIPQISFKSSENIIGWTYARLVVQNFGERFRYRVDTYTGTQSA